MRRLCRTVSARLQYPQGRPGAHYAEASRAVWAGDGRGRGLGPALPWRARSARPALAAQLAPAALLARSDTSHRAIGMVTVIGVPITGSGTVAAGQVSRDGPARDLAVAVVITSTAPVACALTAQVLTITRRFSPENPAEVQAWYQHFQLREIRYLGRPADCRRTGQRAGNGQRRAGTGQSRADRRLGMADLYPSTMQTGHIIRFCGHLMINWQRPDETRTAASVRASGVPASASSRDSRRHVYVLFCARRPLGFANQTGSCIAQPAVRGFDPLGVPGNDRLGIGGAPLLLSHNQTQASESNHDPAWLLLSYLTSCHYDHEWVRWIS